jgi:muconolactone delta-isomerase
MKILAIEKEKPGLTAKDFTPHSKNEAKHVYELQQKGIVREIYFNQEHNAVLILECKDLKEGESILSEFPLVKNGLISFELMELKPYSGFSRLFG